MGDLLPGSGANWTRGNSNRGAQNCLSRQGCPSGGNQAGGKPCAHPGQHLGPQPQRLLCRNDVYARGGSKIGNRPLAGGTPKFWPGRVATCRPQFGNGVQFLEMKPEDATLLRTFLEAESACQELTALNWPRK